MDLFDSIKLDQNSLKILAEPVFWQMMGVEVE